MGTLDRAAVEMRDRHRGQLDAFQAAQIDRGHAIALRVRPLAIRMDPAHRAEAVPDHVLVEQVGVGVVFRRQQPQRLVRTNQSSEPLRWQIEQLQDKAFSIEPSTSNATCPQWQLPL
jgi:hypothetical protein